MREYEALKYMAATHGQEHIFRFWDALPPEGQSNLLRSVQQIDFPLLSHLVDTWLLNQPGAEHFTQLEPVPLIPALPGRDDKDARDALAAGEAALRAGKIGVFLVAGGQGTRLGFDGPKGSYRIGPVTGKSLFEYHAEKIVNHQRRYGVQLPWYLMVSCENDGATRAFFQRHGYFGLDKSQIMFIQQRMMPCVDAEGKILMQAKDAPAMNPNGHGGAILAMTEGAVLEHARKRGIEHLAYFQVDNWAAKIIDPHFIGYHVLQNAQMSSKTHLKTAPREAVGVHCLCDGEHRIIEYSELDLYPQLLETAPSGLPIFNAGNSAIHILSVDFVEERARDFASFPWHLAHKKIPHIDGSGVQHDPPQPNGYKFETFIFDALRFAQHGPVALEIHHAGEYTPIKQFEGANSVLAARQQMSNYWAVWLEAAGVEVPRDAEGQSTFTIEVSPYFAFSMDEFAQKIQGLPLKLTQNIAIDKDGAIALCPEPEN